MKLSELGEFGLIERIASRSKTHLGTVVGIGDDAAVIEIPNSKIQITNKSQNPNYKLSQKYLLVTTDALIEGVHFKLKNGRNREFILRRDPFFNLGYKALAANISDIAAMGGVPTHALVTLGLPKSIEIESVEELYKGLNSLAKKYNIDIVGGDTVASPNAMMISITLLGEVEKENLLLRSTAKVGDLICVTGEFGGAAVKKFEIRDWKLEIRLREARIIAKSQLAHAMIDSSDGLVRSVIEICRASRVGARIWEEAVPRARGANLNHALYGGEEYELVFTLSEKEAGKIIERLKKTTKVSIVGEIVSNKKGIKLLDLHGQEKILKHGGYEHFLK